MVAVLFTWTATAQMEVSMGYIVPLNDNYGKGYLSVGHEGIGGNLILGGDSRISAAGEDRGRGYLGLEGYMNVLRNERTYWRIEPMAGIMITENYERYVGGIANPQNGLPTHLNSKFGFSGGLRIGWKMLEVGYTTNNEIMAGFKLSF